MVLLQAEFGSDCFEGSAGVDDGLLGDAESEAAVAGTLEACARDEEQVVLSADVAEFGVGETVWCLHEDVERAVWLDGFEAGLYDVGVEEVAAVLVVRDVDLGVEGALDDFLPDGWSVDAAECSVGEDDSCSEVVVVCVLGADESVADTLAREGEGFTPGVADDQVVEAVKGCRDFDAVVSKFDVRLVGDDVDHVILLEESGIECAEEVLGVDYAGRVVR